MRQLFSARSKGLEFSLRSRRRAGLFLLGVALPTFFVAAKSVVIALASRESLDPARLRRAALRDPSNAELQNRLGLVYFYSPEEHDPGDSLPYFRRATELNPVKSSYWVDLATTCESVGDLSCADRSLERALALSPMKPRLYWLAANFYLRTGRPDAALPRLERLLELSPEYAAPTFDLCQRMLDNPRATFEKVLSHGRDPKLKLAYADFLSTRGNAEFARKVWDQTVAGASTFPFSLAKPYLESLLDRGRYQDAAAVWRDLERLGIVVRQASGSRDNLVFNGSFEQLPLNTGFDWRFRELPYLTVEFPASGAYEGARCLSLDFTLKSNQDDEPAYQIIPVIPGQEYLLTAFVRSEDVTSASGPRLRVTDLDCRGCMDLSTEQTVGTTPWHPVYLRFSAGARAHFVRVSIWRPRSRSYPAEITGRYSVDAVSLKAARGAPEQGAKSATVVAAANSRRKPAS